MNFIEGIKKDIKECSPELLKKLIIKKEYSFNFKSAYDFKNLQEYKEYLFNIFWGK